MSETQMPAAEATERSRYELAFHVLPTVAEGEVTTVLAAIKAAISKKGGEVFDEEAPARFDLAYDIVKYLEGRNRKFSSAYFGWVRFSLEARELNELMETISPMKELLRHLVIKLTKIEEANPFRFHEAMTVARVENVMVEEEVVEPAEVVEAEVVADVAVGGEEPEMKV